MKKMRIFSSPKRKPRRNGKKYTNKVSVTYQKCKKFWNERPVLFFNVTYIATGDGVNTSPICNRGVPIEVLSKHAACLAGLAARVV